jgi:hypothetical protein
MPQKGAEQISKSKYVVTQIRKAILERKCYNGKITGAGVEIVC